MTATATKTPFVQTPDAVPVFAFAGGQIGIRVGAPQTGGQLAAIENVVPANFPGPPRHIHPAFDELFYVLEGEMVFTVGDDTEHAGPGTIAYVPGDVPHTFSNPHEAPARLLTVCTPGGFESYFEAVIAATPPGALPSPDRMAELMAEHGVMPA